MALLIDYVLTISISCSHAGDALFGFLPVEYHDARLVSVVVFIFILIILNLRGVKESIVVMLPIFLVFLLTHVFGILSVFEDNIEKVPELVSDSVDTITGEWKLAGFAGVLENLSLMACGDRHKRRTSITESPAEGLSCFYY